MVSWQTRANQRLQEFSNNHYSNWLQSKDGQKFKKSKKKGKSPYYFGFSLPDYVHDTIEALKNDDEEKVKYLILLHFID